MRLMLAAALSAALTLPAFAAPLQLTPANPQPSSPKAGLAVSYAFPNKVKTLADARSALKKKANAGPALRGLSYEDNKEGEPALTSQFSTNVAAQIKGYIRFDAPGEYAITFFSNDGIDARIGGQEVAFYDERHPCESAGTVDVSVPSAGWYALEALWFQRKGTACLVMEWSGPGGKGVVPDSVFGH